MQAGVDLGAYFSRIGFTTEAAVDIATLAAIHRLHPEAIPFEGLNPFLKLPVRLDTESLQQKLVAGGRGGYCFENNLLLSAVLREIGFEVTWLAARVLWEAGRDAMTPRTHMVMLVNAGDEVYLADVGFGVLTLTAPLRLVADLVQETPHGRFRLTRSGETYFEEAWIAGEWKTLYRFELHEQQFEDYEMGNWYVSTRPGSRFASGVRAARVVGDRRLALQNNRFRTYALNGETEHRTLTSAAELRHVLEHEFRINLAGLDELHPALERLMQRLNDEAAQGNVKDSQLTLFADNKQEA